MKPIRAPQIEVRNAQRAVSLELHSLQSFAEAAIELSWRRKGARADSMPAVFVTIVSDKRMAQVHKQFCGIAGPTDVLTFRHGEIIISAATAARQALTFHSTLEQELRLYLLHGLLHLRGYDDTTRAGRARMQRLQRELLKVAERRARFEPTRLRVNLPDELVTSRGRSNQRGNRCRRDRSGHREI